MSTGASSSLRLISSSSSPSIFTVMSVCLSLHRGWLTLGSCTSASYWLGTVTSQDTVDEGLIPRGQLGVASRVGDDASGLIL